MHLKPFFCYYGGKWRAAPRYPAPTRRTIVEPFAGAAGYSTRYSDRSVVLVEKDPIVAGLWKYLTRVSSREILSIPTHVENSVDDLVVCQEARWLVGFWVNKGSAAPCKSPSAWMRAGTRPLSYWGEAIRQRIACQVESIRHWRVIEGSYESSPDIEATWFVDPPYQVAGKHYRCSRVDYAALGAWCTTRKGHTIVCENVGATWLPFKPFINIQANQSRSGGKTSQEALWTLST